MPTESQAQALAPKKSNLVVYPETDGKPMESDWHREAMVSSIETLEDYCANNPSVYISGNLFIYYREGDPKTRVSPSLLVSLKAGKGDRNSYFTWKEAPIDLVAETTPLKPKKADLNKKFLVYQNDLQVPDYVLYDPVGGCLNPRLQGFRRVNGVYIPMEQNHGKLVSRSLGLDIELDLVTGCLLFTKSMAGQRLLSRAAKIQQLKQTLDERDLMIHERIQFIQKQDQMILLQDQAIQRMDQLTREQIGFLESLLPDLQGPARDKINQRLAKLRAEVSNHQ